MAAIAIAIPEDIQGVGIQGTIATSCSHQNSCIQSRVGCSLPSYSLLGYNLGIAGSSE